MGNFAQFTKKIVDFREKRDWKQFHTPKDLAISLMLESAEVAEHFQWKTGEELKEYIDTHKSEIGAELADVLYWVLLMSHDLGVDLPKALEAKMKQNESKYPVEKSKGKHTKYTELK